MNSKIIITFVVLLLILPVVLAEVKIQLGEPYINIEELSEIKFTAHADYYEICSLDKTVIPVLIRNNNNFSETFKFEIDKEYASLPVKNAALESGKGAILPLTISPPIELEENTTLIFDVTTKEEGLKRSVIIKTNIKKCYLFDLELSKNKDEICGCDNKTYTLTIHNAGQYTDIFTLMLDMPEWITSTLENDTFELNDGERKEIILEASPSCEEEGFFTGSIEAVSEKSNVALKDELELTVLPKDDCYNTIIDVEDFEIDYFGKNIPIAIKNKGARDATYSLSVEGIDWYTLSQKEFSLKRDKEKTINLALYPDKDVVEGEYNIDITAKTDSQEFTKSITVKLKSKGIVFEKARFYLNYFKYYIGAGIVLLIIILLVIVVIRKRVKKVEKVVKEEKKVGKKVKLIGALKWLFSFILYLIFLALLALFGYSTFKYRAFYEKVLGFISRFFENYIVLYGSYLRYPIAIVGVVLIVILIIDFYRKRPKKKKVKKEKAEVKKVSEKKVRKRKLRLFEYIYLILVILLFLAIAGYAIYRFSGRAALKSFFKTGLLSYVRYFFVLYYPYILMGLGILIILILIMYFRNRKIS